MEIVAVFVGWLLGLASSPAVEWWNRRGERTELTAALVLEFSAIRLRLGGLAYFVCSNHGTLTMARLRWMLTIHEMNGAEEVAPKMPAALRGIINNGEDQLRALNEANRAETVAGGKLISAREIATPVLDQAVRRLFIFDQGRQQLLLRIDPQFRILNELVAELREYKQLTYDQSIRGTQRTALLRNLWQAEESLADRAAYLVDLLEKWER